MPGFNSTPQVFVIEKQFRARFGIAALGNMEAGICIRVDHLPNATKRVRGSQQVLEHWTSGGFRASMDQIRDID